MLNMVYTQFIDICTHEIYYETNICNPTDEFIQSIFDNSLIPLSRDFTIEKIVEFKEHDLIRVYLGVKI